MNKLFQKKTIQLLCRKQLNQYSQIQNSRVLSFNNFNELKQWLTWRQPKLHCVYVRANWNPQCEESDQHFKQLSNEFKQYEFLQVDSDELPIAKSYFDVKCEPEFITLALGQEMTRQTGPSLQRLREKLERTSTQLHTADLIEGTDAYEEFDAKYTRDYEEYDKEFDLWVR